jgi:hypothetical protein
MNIPTPKIGALQMDLKKQNGEFIENCSNSLHFISLIYGDHVPKLNCIGDIFRKIMRPKYKMLFLKQTLPVRSISLLFSIQE